MQVRWVEDMNTASAKDVSGAIKHGPAWQAAEAAGLDMSLVEINLAKPVGQRVRDHDDALNFALKLRKAGELLHVKS
jgi:hypothetical protein